MARLDRENALVAIMRSDGDRLRALSAASPAVSSLPADTAITQEAAASQMTIQRLEKEGDRWNVTIDNCDFPVLIAWLNRLETGHGLRVTDIELNRRPAPGIVSAQVTLEE